jgi:hypothetical protein
MAVAPREANPFVLSDLYHEPNGGDSGSPSGRGLEYACVDANPKKKEIPACVDAVDGACDGKKGRKVKWVTMPNRSKENQGSNEEAWTLFFSLANENGPMLHAPGFLAWALFPGLCWAWNWKRTPPPPCALVVHWPPFADVAPW